MKRDSLERRVERLEKTVMDLAERRASLSRQLTKVKNDLRSAYFFILLAGGSMLLVALAVLLLAIYGGRRG